MRIITTFNSAGWDAFRAGFARIGEEGPSIMAGLLNAGGLALRTKTVAAEQAQTGIKEGVTERAQIAMMEQAKEKADELHISISQPAHPEIDLSAFNAAIDAAQAKWNAFKASISSLGTSLGASLPNLGPVQRGNFSHGGIGHE